MRVLVKLMTAASLLAVSACATIVEGSTDKVAVTTTPPVNANCNFTNGRETISAYAPSTVTVKRSKTDLDISCTEPNTGATGKTTLVSDVEAWDFGNIVIGGLIGMGIDWGTGAAYTYPSSANVTMNMPAMTYAAPEAVTATPEPAAVPAAPAAATETPGLTYIPQPGVPVVVPQSAAPTYMAPMTAPAVVPTVPAATN